MPALDLFLYEEDHIALKQAVERLCRESEAKAVFLIDKNGQQIMAAGDYGDIDTVSLATLAAGNVAATDGLARLLGEQGFTILFHEGERDNIHISIVGDLAILVVIFDERTSVGLVRLRVKRSTDALESVLLQAVERQQALKEQSAKPEQKSGLQEITDEEIENLFK
ncbi:MAG TPA: roadblock/LC7 domain-containing protein [Acidobacteriota bacterium]|nr:roadblock/LC7 domain-containing protein [Acidobacteriota bacterium]